MRAAAFALISFLALGACNPSGQNAGGSDDGIFPSLVGASYRTEANITHEGRTMPLVMIRDGNRLRMEVATPEGQSIIVSNAETGESFIIATAAGRTMAMRTTPENQQFADPALSWTTEIATTSTRTGSCSVAGESGAEWTRTENEVIKTVCVTQDGIILLATEGGATTWEATRVERGPQSAELFELPEGVEVMDMPNIPGMAEALERAKAAREGQ